MKFQCEQCEARYSISDERVRGKILKIRCKKCSHVITVSEDALTEERMQAPAPAPLQGKFEEWFLAIAGNQSGPFTLEEAKEWIKEKPADIEIHCWTEGFDKWKVSDRVSHFRSIARSPQSLDNASGFEPSVPSVFEAAGKNGASLEDEWSDDLATRINGGPEDALADASNQMGAFSSPAAEPATESAGASKDLFEENAAQSSSSINAGLFDSVPEQDEGDLDFDIGEASRVVQLPELLANMHNQPYADSPGEGAGNESGFGAPFSSGAVSSGTASILPSSDEPDQRDKKPLILYGIGGLLFAGMLGVLLFTFLPSDTEQSEISRGTYGGSELGAQFQNEKIREKIIVKEAEKSQQVRKVPRRNSKPSRNSATSTQVKTPKRTNSGAEEFDFGGTKKSTGPLDGGDLVKAVKKYHPYIKRCYERALKKDPFLKAKKANVSVKVSASGKVTSVKIPGMGGTELGNCLQGNIRRWKFRESSGTFSGQFPLIFGS